MKRDRLYSISECKCGPKSLKIIGYIIQQECILVARSHKEKRIELWLKESARLFSNLDGKSVFDVSVVSLTNALFEIEAQSL